MGDLCAVFCVVTLLPVATSWHEGGNGAQLAALLLAGVNGTCTAALNWQCEAAATVGK
jgi:uncharacterized membrane protein